MIIFRKYQVLESLGCWNFFYKFNIATDNRFLKISNESLAI